MTNVAYAAPEVTKKKAEKHKKSKGKSHSGEFPCFFMSGAYGIRTRDLLHAMETRSQLR